MQTAVVHGNIPSCQSLSLWPRAGELSFIFLYSYAVFLHKGFETPHQQMNRVIKEKYLKTNHRMKRRPRENGSRVKKWRRRSKRMRIGKLGGAARSSGLGSRLPGQQHRKSRCSAVPRRNRFLLDQRSLARTSAGDSEHRWLCTCSSSFLPTVVPAKCPAAPPVTPLSSSSRDHESLSPGRWLRRHSRR